MTIYKTTKQKDKDKLVFIDITNMRLDRYVGNLITFFKICGYTVCLPRNKNLIYSLSSKRGEVKYASWVIDKDVKFKKPIKNKDVLYLSDKMLSNNYFNTSGTNKNSYYIPMSEYPLMYHNYLSRKEIKTSIARNCSIFMSGNFSKDSYYQISNDNVFNILSRREIYDFVILKNYYKKLSSVKYFELPIAEIEEYKVYLINRHTDFSIDLYKLKSILIKFDFFMALPGVVMPQSHNLIEAMSVGCIPIMHKTYADLLTPQLTHLENCLVYSTLLELDTLINEAFKLPQEQIREMRKNVIRYYLEHLTPESVVKTILDSEFQILYVQAEQKSVALLKKNNFQINKK